MEKKETIQSAPEIMNISGAFQKFISLLGNEDRTIEDFYSLMAIPSIERDTLLANYDPVIVASESIIRQQFEL